MIDPRDPDYGDRPGSASRRLLDRAPADAAAAPVVTLLTPFYCPGSRFEPTARTVLAQSFQQWEWLIVNDGSSDDESLAVLDGCRAADPRIRVIDHDHNRGLPAARNTGVAASRCDFVFLIDDDDLLEPTAVEKQLWFLASRPELAFCNSWTVAFGDREYLWSAGFEAGDEFLQRNLVSGRALLRRSAFEAAGGYDESLREGFEDWDFWLRCADAGLWGATIPEYLDWYRRREHHGDRWASLRSNASVETFRERLIARHTRVSERGVPHVARDEPGPFGRGIDPLGPNRLRVDGPSALLILESFDGPGADEALDAVDRLVDRGWHVAVVATAADAHDRMPAFAKLAPDTFALSHFLRRADQPRFIEYLLTSRNVAVVAAADSGLGARLLPVLEDRFRCADLAAGAAGIEEAHARPLRSVEAPMSAELERDWATHAAELARLSDLVDPRVPGPELGAIFRQIDELGRARESQQEHRRWLEEQCHSWSVQFDERRAHLDELRAWRDELESARDWLGEQCSGLSATARDREETLADLRAHVEEQTKGIEWLDRQCAHLREVTGQRASEIRRLAARESAS